MRASLRFWQVACVELAIALIGPLQAARPVATTVYPTGAFPLDAQNVQAAIDRGGTVLLKAANASGQPTAFNFGPPDPVVNGGVALTTDVSLVGETVGNDQTTIRGGFNPILGLAPVTSTIAGIHFDGPLDSPIALIRSTGATITGNRITGIVPLPLFFGFTEIEGIFVSGFDDPQHAITGKVTIADNVIEISGGDFVNGMQFDEVAADIEVRGNTVRFLSSDGAVQTLGILVFRSHGKADVVGNTIVMGNGNPDAFPGGIFVGGHAEAQYRIDRNSVTTLHPNADGIDVVGLSSAIPTAKARVTSNVVSMQSTVETSGALVLAGAVQDTVVSGNRAAGTAGNPVQVLGLDSSLVADSNHVVGNDIGGLAPVGVDVFFGPDSANNTYAGQCRSFVDLGTNNHIACGGPSHGNGKAARSTRRAGDAMRTVGDQVLHAKLGLHRREGR